MNDAGQIVGNAQLPGANITHGFLWTATGGIHALPSLKGNEDGNASSINASGEIVGFGLDANIHQRALVWSTSTGLHDLNQLAVNSPLILLMAAHVNSSGQIVGVGHAKSNAALAHAFLATPTGK